MISSACAAAPVTPLQSLQMQRSRVDAGISDRTALLDRIHFSGHNDDSVQLASINAAELTVEYALQAVEAVVAIDERARLGHAPCNQPESRWR